MDLFAQHIGQDLHGADDRAVITDQLQQAQPVALGYHLHLGFGAGAAIGDFEIYRKWF